jgi:hypothetical protein
MLDRRIAAALPLLTLLSACGSSSTTLTQPCTLLTKTIAAQITGDDAITNQGRNVTETLSGYVACIFADTKNEANSVTVQVKRTVGSANRSTLQAAVAFFSRGEPVAPYQSFPATAVGDDALGESTLGVAFIVFSRGDALVYVGAASSLRSTSVLQLGVEALAKKIASAV